MANSRWTFYGYVLRKTVPDDLALATAWTPRALDAGFWLKQDARHGTFLVMQAGEPLGLFQTERVRPDQTRLHFQGSPTASRKKILRAITKLVPMIERALYLSGVRAIFFTSHSPQMVTFMQKLGYETKMEWGTLDGQAMAKRWRDKA